MKTVYIIFSHASGQTFFRGVVDCEEKALRWKEELEEADKKFTDDCKSNHYYCKEAVI